MKRNQIAWWLWSIGTVLIVMSWSFDCAMKVLAREYGPENVRLVFCFGM